MKITIKMMPKSQMPEKDDMEDMDDMMEEGMGEMPMMETKKKFKLPMKKKKKAIEAGISSIAELKKIAKEKRNKAAKLV